MELQRSMIVVACVAVCGVPASAQLSAQIGFQGAYTIAAPLVSCAYPGPASKTAFLTTDLQVGLYVAVSNAAVGDTLEVDVYRPDGKFYTSLSFGPLTEQGETCFGNGFVTLAGQPAINYLGTWTVKGFWDSQPLFASSFTLSTPSITAPGGPTGVNLLKNPGGEQTNGDPNCLASSFLPAWSINSPGVSLCEYGHGPISATNPGPPDRGVNYFAGGP